MKHILNILLVAIFTISSVSFGQTKVDGSWLKGDVIGGTAANTRRIVIPKNTKANLDALSRKEATLVYATDDQKLLIDNGTDLSPIGSGSGVINLITNGDAESGQPLDKYHDGTVDVPVDGTGTAAGYYQVVSSIISTNFINEKKSFQLYGSTGVVKGVGLSRTFTVPTAYKGKNLKISFENNYTFASYLADGLIKVFVYDITNAKIIEPNSLKVPAWKGTDLSGKYESSFNTSSNGSDYRLLIHFSDNIVGSDFYLRADDLTVTPSQATYQPTITNWTNFTPTGTWTTNSTYTGKWRRVGDTMQVQMKIALAGAPNSTGLNINLPSGYVIDTAKLVSSLSGGNFVKGRASVLDNGATVYDAMLLYNNTTSIGITALTASGTFTTVNGLTQLVPITFGTADTVDVQYEVPIVGWDLGAQVSDGYEAREISFRAAFSGLTGINPNNSAVKLLIPSAQYDSVSGWASNGWTIKSGGVYDFEGSFGVVNTNVLGAYYQLMIYKNGVAVGVGQQYLAAINTYFAITVAANSIPCVAGDIIDIRFFGTGNNSVSTLSQNNTGYFSGNKHQAPTTTSAGSITLAIATIPGTTAVTASTAIAYNTVVEDTCGCLTAPGRFTAKEAGLYMVGANLDTVAANSIRLYKNGSVGNYLSTASASGFGGFGFPVRLNAGEYVDIRPDASSTTQAVSTFYVYKIK